MRGLELFHSLVKRVSQRFELVAATVKRQPRIKKEQRRNDGLAPGFFGALPSLKKQLLENGGSKLGLALLKLHRRSGLARKSERLAGEHIGVGQIRNLNRQCATPLVVERKFAIDQPIGVEPFAETDTRRSAEQLKFAQFKFAAREIQLRPFDPFDFRFLGKFILKKAGEAGGSLGAEIGIIIHSKVHERDANGCKGTLCQ